MAWIESHQSLARHRKTLRAAALLGISRPTLVGHLHFLWWWALDNLKEDGLLGNLSSGELAAAAEWDGDADAFMDALVQAVFIDRKPRALHDWPEYAGKLMERREANRLRMREKRAAHVQDTTSARAPATVPNPTVPNRTEQKERGIAPRKRSATKPKETVLTLPYIRSLVVDFGPKLGGWRGVIEEIRNARGHQAWKKWPDHRRYVRNWLTKATVFRAEHPALTPARVQAPTVAPMPWGGDPPPYATPSVNGETHERNLADWKKRHGPLSRYPVELGGKLRKDS